MTYYDWIGFTDEDNHPLGTPPIEDASGCAFFIDFDGTLVEIAETPGGIKVDASVKGMLSRLYEATGGRLAVVSGRHLSDLRTYLPDFDGPLIGSHGAERFDRGKDYLHPAANCGELGTMRKMVKAYLDDEPGILLEEKPASLVLHFRQAPERMTASDQFLSLLAEQYPNWHVHHAKMALELMHNDISKGSAIRPYMEAWRPATPVAIGDDSTDEAMFCAVQKVGGIGIKVGADRSNARYSLSTVSDVHEFLTGLVGGA